MAVIDDIKAELDSEYTLCAPRWKAVIRTAVEALGTVRTQAGLDWGEVVGCNRDTAEKALASIGETLGLPDPDIAACEAGMERMGFTPTENSDGR